MLELRDSMSARKITGMFMASAALFVAACVQSPLDSDARGAAANNASADQVAPNSAHTAPNPNGPTSTLALAPGGGSSLPPR